MFLFGPGRRVPWRNKVWVGGWVGGGGGLLLLLSLLLLLLIVLLLVFIIIFLFNYFLSVRALGRYPARYAL